MVKTKYEREKVGISQQEKTCWTEFRNSVQQRNALILCRLHLLLRSGQHLKINGDHYRSHATQTLAGAAERQPLDTGSTNSVPA